MADTLTPAGLLRLFGAVFADVNTQQMRPDLTVGAIAKACEAGADALDRLAQTCGNCQHANIADGQREGWCYCATAPPPGLMFVGPDEREKWAQKREFQRRFPFWGEAIPLDERCKGWTKREDA